MDDSEEKFFESLAGGMHRASVPKGKDAEDEEEGGDKSVNHKKARVVKTEEEETNQVDEFDSEPEGQLTIDVYQTPSDIVIESAVAGVKPEDLDITVTNDSVSIRGHRRRDTQIKDEDYFYQECYWGRFSRSVILPQEIDAEVSSVSFKNGVLTIRLPKLNRKKTKKLKVKLE